MTQDPLNTGEDSTEDKGIQSHADSTEQVGHRLAVLSEATRTNSENLEKILGYFEREDGLWARIATIQITIEGLAKNSATKADIINLKNKVDGLNKNSATKGDITNLKIWCLGGVIVGLLAIIGLLLKVVWKYL